MSKHPTSFAEWQNYPSSLDPIHVAWLKNAKKAKTAFAVADIEGLEISHKKLLIIVPNKMLDCFSQVVGVEQ